MVRVFGAAMPPSRLNAFIVSRALLQFAMTVPPVSPGYEREGLGIGFTGGSGLSCCAIVLLRGRLPRTRSYTSQTFGCGGEVYGIDRSPLVHGSP